MRRLSCFFNSEIVAHHVFSVETNDTQHKDERGLKSYGKNKISNLDGVSYTNNSSGCVSYYDACNDNIQHFIKKVMLFIL